ncbi:MAG: glycosyltransferase family 4 protein [Bryobacteraceae bacterium]|nr:glycosyltransferase family 4 protein [Bryobacteraceae bacterium]
MIALDASYSLDPQPTGVAVYSQRLLRGLAAAQPAQDFAWCYRGHRYLQAPPSQGNCRRRLLLDAGPLTLRAPQIFHGLNQRLPRRKRSPSVATFHDLFVLSAEYSTADFRQRFAEQARNAARQADLVIAVSQFTASQVEHHLGVPRSRIRVVPHGVDLADPPIGDQERLPVILHLGAIQKRKNLRMLVEAFSGVPEPWELHLAGGHGYGADEVLAAVEQSPVRARIRLPGYLSPDELGRAYRQASVFAFPSLDEGFGIPVLEAMAHGLPVLTSTRSALPEAAGGAAWLLDPDDTAAWTAALQQLCGDPHLRRQWQARGLARVADCGWPHAVAATWRVYAELLI